MPHGYDTQVGERGLKLSGLLHHYDYCLNMVSSAQASERAVCLVYFPGWLTKLEKNGKLSQKLAASDLNSNP